MIAVALIAQYTPAQTSVLLPNGWALQPAGKTIALNSDLPMNMALDPTGKYIAITNNGVGGQSLQLVSAHTQSLLFTCPVKKSWLGLKFNDDGKRLYASGGNDNKILVYTVAGDSLALSDSIILGRPWPVKISPTGIETDEVNKRLYVVTKENNTLYVINLATKKVIKKVQLGAEAYTCLLSPDKHKLYITLWGGRQLACYDILEQRISATVNVGQNPNDICQVKNGQYLFVANAVDNSVSVIDSRTFKVIEILNAALYPAAPAGSTTNSVALSPDEKQLYIANADNNCLAVFDISHPGKCFSKGFIPTGWYPTCVRTDKGHIYVLNGKGNTSLPNPDGPQPVKKGEVDNYKKANKKSSQYIGGLFKGTLSIINPEGQGLLEQWTKQVYANTPYTKEKETVAEGEAGNPIPRKQEDTSPIKHVFYIIKENRTYDQVLSDMPGGNGDTSLLLFGEAVTPNQHALARQFVLLDNFYVDAEVSADGHNWSMAAYANDFVEKTWPTNYGGRGGNYDFAANRKIALPRNGFLWDYALRKGLSFRDYGEFTDDEGIVYLPDLKKHMCPGYTGWNLKYKDIEREQVWERDFDSLAEINQVPALNIIYFPNDHTAGLNKKDRTPNAYLADNDLAVGWLIEHLSKSRVWEHSAVFILEDDAQNGPDHVDAHRSIAFVAGPYVMRGYIDHTMYSTSSMLRTMELILGLPPMSQYDAAATPMYRCFTPKADNSPFHYIEGNINLDEYNTAAAELNRESELMDFSGADHAPDLELNVLLWKSVKGTIPYPGINRAAFVKVRKIKDEDD